MSENDDFPFPKVNHSTIHNNTRPAKLGGPEPKEIQIGISKLNHRVERLSIGIDVWKPQPFFFSEKFPLGNFLFVVFVVMGRIYRMVVLILDLYKKKQRNVQDIPMARIVRKSENILGCAEVV